MISRRKFAALLGVGAVGLPLTTILGRRIVRAQPTVAPVRFLAVRTPHGVDRDWWIPKMASGADPSGTNVPLMDLTFEYPQAILQPLMDWRERITILDGMDSEVVKEGTRAGVRTFHGHNEQGTMLTGAQPPEDRESGNFDGHPSLDFYFHSRLPAHALITACVEPNGGSWKSMSYDDGGLPRSAESDPRTVFRAAFPSDFMADEPVTPIDYRPGESALAAHNLGSLREFRERLTGEERVKLDVHIAAMEGLAGTGVGPGTMLAACTTSGMDVPTRNGNIGSYLEVEDVTRAHSRVIAQAFACGQARNATLQILNDYPNYPSELPEVRTPEILARYGDTGRFHENLVHDYWGASGTDLTNLRVGYLAGLRWLAVQFRAVLEELDAIQDPQDASGGSVLDNTIVYWHNEFGHDGHDNQHTRHPIVIAGGGGRTLALGRYLRLRDIASGDRVPHNLLLTSIAQAVGLTDVSYFGDRDLRTRAEYQGPLVPLMV